MNLRSITLAGALLAFSAPVFASFGGCVISPENPTLILGAIGGGAASLPWVRAQLPVRFGRTGK